MRVFVLDTSAWSGIKDQDLQLNDSIERPTRPGLETRLTSQVAAMKMMCCSELPHDVGVVRMGSVGASVEFEISRRWHCLKRARGATMEAGEQFIRAFYKHSPPKMADAEILKGQGYLCRYRPDPDPVEEVPAAPDPRRLARALRLALAELKRVGFASWKETDLFVRTEDSARVTVFLCSPPVGLMPEMEDLEAACKELHRADVEVEIILHPNAYPASFDRFRRASPTEGDAAGSLPASLSHLRCDDEDLGVLRSAIDKNLNHSIATDSFVTTLSMYSKTYFCLDTPEDLRLRWRMCFPFIQTEGAGVQYPRILETAMWEGTGSRRSRRSLRSSPDGMDDESLEDDDPDCDGAKFLKPPPRFSAGSSPSTSPSAKVVALI